MKKLKNFILFAISCVMMINSFSIAVLASTNDLPTISENKPLYTYAYIMDDSSNRRVYVYKDAALTIKGRNEYIDECDELKVIQKDENYNSILVEYSTYSGGRKQRWISANHIKFLNSYRYSGKANDKITTYKFSDENKGEYGYISPGDGVVFYEKKGHYYRVLYKTNVGYKMAWINEFHLYYSISYLKNRDGSKAYL